MLIYNIYIYFCLTFSNLIPLHYFFMFFHAQLPTIVGGLYKIYMYSNHIYAVFFSPSTHQNIRKVFILQVYN